MAKRKTFATADDLIRDLLRKHTKKELIELVISAVSSNEGTDFVVSDPTGSVSAAPFCGSCGVFHIPGQGLCTATYTNSQPS